MHVWTDWNESGWERVVIEVGTGGKRQDTDSKISCRGKVVVREKPVIKIVN